MSLFQNASPEFVSLGMEDAGGRAVTPERAPLPQALMKFYIKARKGPTKDTIVTGKNLITLYGEETFDKNGEYYNHQTKTLMAVVSAGSTVIAKRVIPTSEATPRSNITLYMDILDSELPNYVRNSDGSFAVDAATNDYIINSTTPTVTGREIKFITEYSSTTNLELGLSTSKTGTMSYVDGSGATITSTMVPLLEFDAKEYGEYYNNLGFSIESLFNNDLDIGTAQEIKSLLYRLALYTRKAVGVTPVVRRTLFAEPAVEFSLRPGVIDPRTKAPIDLETTFDNNWFNETDPLKALVPNDYSGIHIYTDNISARLTSFIEQEQPHLSNTPVTWNDGIDAANAAWFDYTTIDAAEIKDENYLLNPFTSTSSQGVPYYTLRPSERVSVLSSTQREVNITKNTPIFLAGGSDGDLSNDAYETVVGADLDVYLDNDSRYMDTAISKENMFFDTGFGLDIKERAAAFITLRSNTAVFLGTHDAELGNKDLPLSGARAVGLALRTRLRLAPESTYFGTETARAFIVIGTGKERTSSTKERTSLVHELAVKIARMMGAGNYKWKASEAFDHGEKAVLTELIDITPDFVPNGIKPTLWSDGLIWAQSKDREEFFFPATQSVYTDDTSPVNGLLTIVAAMTADTIANDSWREFSGASTLKDPEFIEAVLTYLNNRFMPPQGDIFDGLVKVIPEVIIEGKDKERGYSYRVINNIYSGTMKTKMVYSSRIFRSSDLV